VLAGSALLLPASFNSFGIYGFAAFVVTHVLGRLCRALGTRLQAAPRDIVTAWPGTPVVHNLAATESFQDLINYFAVVQMVAPVREHTFNNFFAFGFRHCHHLTS
jgi:hypothetical protein